MGITIFVLLFSIGMMALLAVLLKIEKLPPSLFAAIIGFLVVFDFALLSLDKIYFLHQAQDDLFLEKQKAYDNRISNQVALYHNLTDIQLNITLQALSQNSKQETEGSIQQKLNWRDELLIQMDAVGFDDEKILQVNKKINESVTSYLMERLNQAARQALGHRIYSEFVRSRPRSEWTDELFASELSAYLNKQNLMDGTIGFSLKRLKEFKVSGVLLGVKKEPIEEKSTAKIK
jgi:hypothetical protein